MSTVTPEASSTTDHRLVISLFDHPGADIVLCSQDSHHIQVPKIYIVNSSPVLCELIQKASDSPSNWNAGVSLPVVPLPESGEILRCLLTFIFPITPRIPSTLEEIMELLSAAQKYQMETALAHIRANVAQQNLLPTRLEPALRIYALAQEYGLRQEALHTARTILKYPMTIEDLDNKLDIMPGASLYELWKYYERVRVVLASDLAEFRESGARGTVTGLPCTRHPSSQIPRWLDQFIESITITPNLFDSAELHIAMVRHLRVKPTWFGILDCKCLSIPGQTIREFWEALAPVVNSSFLKVSGMIYGAAQDIEPFSRQSQLYVSYGNERILKFRSTQPRLNL
jgi:BTB/POZ domain